MPEKVKVATTNDVKEGAALAVDAKGQPVALFQHQGKVYALDGRCPHRGGPLGEGFVSGDKVTCPWHGWSFDVKTGASTMSPSIKQPCMEVSIEGTDIFVTV